MSENLRSVEEIKQALTDYMKLSAEKFDAKYRTATNQQRVGFVKGLRWALKL